MIILEAKQNWWNWLFLSRGFSWVLTVECIQVVIGGFPERFLDKKRRRMLLWWLFLECLMYLYISVIAGIDASGEKETPKSLWIISDQWCRFLSIVYHVHQVFEKKLDRPVISDQQTIQGKVVGTPCKIRILKNGLLICLIL